jgi:RND family efflux transporter MFP subunit
MGRGVLWICLLLAGQAGAQSDLQRTDYSRIGIETSGADLRGIVECKTDLELAFPVSGIVAIVPVQEGAEVAKGALLLGLQQSMEAIDLERKREIWADKSEFTSVAAQLVLARKQLESAQRIYDSSRGISAEELANRRLQVDLLMTERARIEGLERIEKLDMEAAREVLERRSLRAPAPGTVSLVLRDVGEAVQPSDVVLRLCDTSELFVATNMPASQAAQLSVGDVLPFAGLQQDQENLRARITFLSPVVDPASGLQRVRLRLLDPPGWVRPGTTLTLQSDG